MCVHGCCHCHCACHRLRWCPHCCRYVSRWHQHSYCYPVIPIERQRLICDTPNSASMLARGLIAK